jgi:hypothetical protein
VQKFKVWFGVLKRSYSCLLGIITNALYLVALGADRLFPPDPLNLINPTFFGFMLLYMYILVPAAVISVIYDLLKGRWILAMAGIVACLGPLLWLGY